MTTINLKTTSDEELVDFFGKSAIMERRAEINKNRPEADKNFLYQRGAYDELKSRGRESLAKLMFLFENGNDTERVRTAQFLLPDFTKEALETLNDVWEWSAQPEKGRAGMAIDNWEKRSPFNPNLKLPVD